MNDVMEIKDDAAEPNRFIRWSRICKGLDDCDPITLARACAAHEIPITRLGPRLRGLTQENYDLLLSRATKEARHDG